MAIESKKVDPIIMAVIDSRFGGITGEAAAAMVRSSRSTIFAEARDFAIGIFDKDLRLIAQKEYIPVLAGANAISLPYIVAAHKGNINEGDIFIHNHSYAGNTHLGDVNIAKPVFYKGELMFWVIVKGHMADTGNKGVAGNDPTSTSIWQDGLIIPSIKLYDRGKLNEAVRDFYLANLKLPEIVWGDIMCDIGGCTVAGRRLVEILDYLGADIVYRAIDEILAASEREVRDMIKQIPDGIYYGEKSTDHDAIHRDKPVTARVKVIKQGDELTIDLSDSDPTVAGYINSTWANTNSVCQMIVAYALPGVPKRNYGAAKPIKVVASYGTWANPSFPAPVAKATTIATSCIGEALLLALSKAIPSSVAPAPGKMCQYFASGVNPRTKRKWVDIDFLCCSVPSSGTEGYDGWDLGGPMFNLGSMRVPDIEITELVKPVRILKHEQEIDSAGAGKFRSGLGHAYRVQYLADTYPGCALVGDGMRAFSPPTGLFGGKSPKPNTCDIHRAHGQTEKIDVGTVVDMHAGDIMEIHLNGAAGFGHPFERDIEKVREDVANEVVSIEGAKRDYGVVINPVTLEVDIKATEELRRCKRS